MKIIINPGSENKGGTFEQAKINAENWLNKIHADGFNEVELGFIKQLDDGDFLFHFIHSVTKKIATLEIHGFTDDELKNFRFNPRVYWNGSSTASPQIDDWLTDDFNYRIEYYRK